MGELRKFRQGFHSFLVFILAFFLWAPGIVSANSNEQPVLNYVALGDSLAEGILNNKTKGKGYPDFIKELFEKGTGYEVNLNNFGVGGYTTKDVLNQLEDEEVIAAIEQADIITYDAGANDLLDVVDLGNLDDPELLLKVGLALEGIKTNLKETLDIIKGLNEDAQIFVMGYYNALWQYPAEHQNLIEMLIKDFLNQAIIDIANEKGAIYVSTYEAFDDRYAEFLPLPDIHPNEAGYEVIAWEFLEQIIPATGATYWFSGEGDEMDAVPKKINGSKFLDVTTLEVYEFDGNEWALVESFSAEEDPIHGEGVPAHDVGEIGDLYLDVHANLLYIKVDTSLWLLLGEANLPEDPDDGDNGEDPKEEEPPVEEPPVEDPSEDKDGSDDGQQGDATDDEDGSKDDSSKDDKDGQKDEDTNKEDSKKDGQRLPDTATNTGNYLVLGLILVVTSILSMVLLKKYKPSFLQC